MVTRKNVQSASVFLMSWLINRNKRIKKKKMENTNDDFYVELNPADFRCIRFPEKEEQRQKEKTQITLNQLNRTFKDFGIRMYAEPGEWTSA